MSNSLQHLPFESVWKMRIDHPYSLFVRDGEELWSCGQCPLDEKGQVLFPHDLLAQADAVAGFIDHFLPKIGADRSSVAQLVVYYVKAADGDAERLMRQFHAHFGNEIIVIPVSIPHFYYDGMTIEVDVYGSTGAKTFSRNVDDTTCAELAVVRTGELGWAGLMVPRELELKPALNRLFKNAGLSPEQVLSAQWFVASNDIAKQVKDLGYGTVGEFHQLVGMQNDDLAAVAQFTFSSDTVIDKRYDPTSHAVADVDVRLTRSGRYFSVAGRCLASLGLVEETRRVMRGIAWVMEREGLSFADIRKATTHYIAGGSPEELHDNMSVRNQYYQKPGPGSTGLPVFSLPGAKSDIAVRMFGKLPETVVPDSAGA